eukprot:NODE_6048_length_578_cov_407.917960_g5883_i0.p2 GENE.NODE_6048_length_578_cov_407.917960_g5883_i0~~NODE_6048_length_578_cov_407.917960_g5883_i0.p2  ORF type:complete len:112 (+),score=34.41 NODE_6048_length_578_cov_407.917960_g5883_i0:79-414(+)
MAQTAELACTYACLLLQDDELAITADSIQAVLDAANVTVEPFYPGLFAKFLQTTDINSLLSNIGTGGGGGGGAAAPAAAGGAAPAAEAKKEEKKKEESEEEDDDMGFGLFD